MIRYDENDWVTQALLRWGYYQRGEPLPARLAYPSQSPGTYLTGKPPQRTDEEEAEAERLALVARKAKTRTVKSIDPDTGKARKRQERVRHMIDLAQPKQKRSFAPPSGEEWPDDVMVVEMIIAGRPKEQQMSAHQKYVMLADDHMAADRLRVSRATHQNRINLVRAAVEGYWQAMFDRAVLHSA